MRDPVERRELMGEEDRVPQHRHQHRRPERDPLGARSDRGEQRDRVVARLGDHRIADPDRVEPDFLGQVAELENAVGVVLALHHALAGGEEIAQLEGHGASFTGKAEICRNGPYRGT